MSILATRKHAILQARERQMRLNELAASGGRPYIEARLWRAPNETDVSWLGDYKRGIVGRKERACLVNDCGRVAAKINQYLFKTKAERTGIDPAFEMSCAGDCGGINDLMQDVSRSVTCAGWCWVQVDRAPLDVGADGQRVELTLADRTPVKLTKWDAVDVPDWRINAAGEVEWLITRSHFYDNANPHTSAKMYEITTLYEREDGKVYVTEETNGGTFRCRVHEELPGMTQIPFVPVGKPSIKAWWFDDLENIQAQNLNLDSSHNETLTDSVYPQMVLPLSLVNSLEATLREEGVNGEQVVSLVRELTVGRHTPIIESGEDKGVSRFIAPGGDLKMLTDEITRKRSLLFDVAGLALMNRETRQVQSAEAKQFDQLDTNSTLGMRALLLQDAERRIVAMCRMFDPLFEAWEPVYPVKFDVVDVGTLTQAVTMILNLPDVPGKMQQAALKCTAKVLKELGAVTEGETAEMLAEIEGMAKRKPDVVPDLYGDEDGDEGEVEVESRSRREGGGDELTQEEAEKLYREIMGK